MTFRRRIDNLSSVCFDIEKSLPLFDIFNENSESQDLRRALYRIRVEINSLLNRAKDVDDVLELDRRTPDVHRELFDERS